MSDSIILLLKFTKKTDSSEIFICRHYFSESVDTNDFREELEEILDK